MAEKRFSEQETNLAYKALYRKWRPQKFSEVIGQDYTVKILKSSIAAGKLSHAYMFAGSRGTGKTSVARIFAKAVNCLKPQDGEPCNGCDNCRRITRGISLDILEIDGASNRGIDQMRRLREEVNFVPAETRYKVYIIDEVHMLTNEAFNALLKTLEEPPRRVIFIFATTEPHKVPPTVASRCQAFEFKNIPAELIEGRLKKICAGEKIKASSAALISIARRAKGSARDAEVMLEQLASYKGREGIEENDLLEVMGLAGEEVVLNFLSSLLKRGAEESLAIIADTRGRGKDLDLFLESSIELCRDLIVNQVSGLKDERLKRLLGGPSSNESIVEELIQLSSQLLELKREMRFSLDKRIMLEVGALKIIEGGREAKELEDVGTLVNMERSSSANPPTGERAEDVKDDKWGKMLETIKKERIAIYAFLAEGRPKVEGDNLKIEFAPEFKFHKESLEKPENRRFLESMIKESYGSLSLEIAFSSGTSHPGESKEEELQEKAELVKRSFDGKIVS